MNQREWTEELIAQLHAHDGDNDCDLKIFHDDDGEALEIRDCQFDPSSNTINLRVGCAD